MKVMLGKTILLTVVLCGLAACSTPTPYQPALNGYGFSQQQIEGNRFRVSFTGNSLTPRQTVENYLLYRAAEVTLINGGDHFVVANRDVEIDSRNDYAPGPGFYSGFGIGSHRRHSSSGILFSTPGPTVTQYRAFADIVIFRGDKPANDPNSYDARDVMSRLGPIIKRPAPPDAG